mmetsp:Transcript_24250/g.77860  ORF Transcript_24250/g.77860 Transcript_24250/m.77860 type:complete len:269 (+) Transcript_24250:88-894(+)
MAGVGRAADACGDRVGSGRFRGVCLLSGSVVQLLPAGGLGGFGDGIRAVGRDGGVLGHGVLLAVPLPARTAAGARSDGQFADGRHHADLLLLQRRLHDAHAGTHSQGCGLCTHPAGCAAQFPGNHQRGVHHFLVPDRAGHLAAHAQRAHAEHMGAIDGRCVRASVPHPVEHVAAWARRPLHLREPQVQPAAQRVPRPLPLRPDLGHLCHLRRPLVQRPHRLLLGLCAHHAQVCAQHQTPSPARRPCLRRRLLRPLHRRRHCGTQALHC